MGLAAAAVIAIPLTVYGVYRFAPRSASALDTEKQLIANVLEEVSSNVAAQRTVRAYGLGGRSHRRFAHHIAALGEASKRAEGRIGMEVVIAEYAVELVKLVIILAGAGLALTGSLALGSFAAFAAIVTEFAHQASVLGMEVMPNIKQSEAGIRRIDSLLATEPRIDERRTQPAPSMSATIRLEGIVLRYRAGEAPQLSGVSFEMLPHSYLAVVGPNGSGKSSILNVLLGLYEVDSGSVIVDDVDLATVDIEAVRDRVGIAFQDTYLFDDSIRNNVTLGLDTYDEETLYQTLETAGLATLVDHLDDGVDTRIGMGGVSLSAGEAQRIGIARALVRNPDLLLLDEVTSGLDPASEADLLNTIEAFRHGRSIVSVTHRLETVKTSDRIVVVDAGAVVESGTFEELLSSNGLFRSMWTKQQGFEISAGGLTASVQPERLLDIAVFSELDEATVNSLASVFESQYLEPGELVFSEGQLGDAFYVIARGVVEVVHGLDTPDERVIARLEDGDFFGEMALLSSQRRNASIRVRRATTLLRLDQRSFRQLLDSSSTARQTIEEAAAQRKQDNARLG
jgi:ATP-binding cassette subfamily B protein